MGGRREEATGKYREDTSVASDVNRKVFVFSVCSFIFGISGN